MRNKQENEMKQVIHSYRNLLSQLSSKLIDSLTRFDTLCLYLAVVILLHVSVENIVLENRNKINDSFHSSY